MSSFAVSYRQNFWLFFFVHLLTVGLYVFLEGTRLAPVLELLILVLIIIFSVIHFVGLLAVLMDTHRCARNNSIYLRKLTEQFESDVQKGDEEAQSGSSETLLEENKNL